jgi:5-methylcytosine-specific restriction endonuclease McrA
MNCTHCGKALNRVQHSQDGKLKSCPNCSVEGGGGEHVFHTHPAAFGQTQKRVTERNPEGDQSWCETCRSKKGPVSGTRCSQVTE